MLTLLWALPAAGALAAALAGRRAAWLGPVLSAVAFVLSLALWPQAGALTERVPWFHGPYGAAVTYSLGLSGLSLLLVAMTLLVTALAGWAGRGRGPAFVAWLTMLGAAATGMFLARDLVLFYLFWEAMLVPTYFLLAGWGGPSRARVAWKFLLYNVGGSVALLLGLAALVTFGAAMPGGPSGAGAALPPAVVGPIALALAIGFAVKTPLFPLHGWVADTYAELPPPAAALVAAVQSKAGLYGMLAILLPLLPGGIAAWAPVLIAAGLVSVLYGAFVALSSDDPRRLLAYSSVSHLGLIAVAFSTRVGVAVTGGVIALVAHGLVTAALFLLLGMLEDRVGGPLRLRDLGGLARSAPGLAGALTLLGMAALGLPGLAGFPGDLLMLIGIYRYSPWLAVAAGLGLVLSAVYMLRVIQLVLHGPAREGARAAGDLRPAERWLLAPFALLLLGIGVYPNPVPALAAPAVASATAGAPVPAASGPAPAASGTQGGSAS